MSIFLGAVLPCHRDRPISDAVDALLLGRGSQLDVFAERYEELRRDRPDDFTVSPEEYGRCFYS